MAAIVKRDHFVEARAHIFHTGTLGEKTREFPNSFFERMHARKGFRLLVKKLGEMMNNHRRAGARGDHDGLARFKCIEEMAGHGTGFGAVAAVKRRLAAAS